MQSIKKGFLVDENPFKREESVGMLKEILKKDEEVDLTKYKLCDCGYPLMTKEREIEMETDVYFITFASMNIEFINKVELNQKDISNCIRNSLFVFIVQVILILGIGWEYLSLDSYKQGSTEMLTVRFVACAMLHVMIQGEVRSAMEKLKYLVDHDQHFILQNYAFMVCMMQFIIGVMTEFFSICLVCGQDEMQDVIILFIALAIIADFDNFFAESWD